MADVDAPNPSDVIFPVLFVKWEPGHLANKTKH